jgi:hypothetical protein
VGLSGLGIPVDGPNSALLNDFSTAYVEVAIATHAEVPLGWSELGLYTTEEEGHDWSALHLLRAAGPYQLLQVPLSVLTNTEGGSPLTSDIVGSEGIAGARVGTTWELGETVCLDAIRVAW